MVESEREMIRNLEQQKTSEKFTSLQPTYEDTVPPDTDDWEHEHEYGS